MSWHLVWGIFSLKYTEWWVHQLEKPKMFSIAINPRQAVSSSSIAQEVRPSVVSLLCSLASFLAGVYFKSHWRFLDHLLQKPNKWVKKCKASNTFSTILQDGEDSHSTSPSFFSQMPRRTHMHTERYTWLKSLLHSVQDRRDRFSSKY